MRGQLGHDLLRAKRRADGQGPWAAGEERVGLPTLIMHDNTVALAPAGYCSDGGGGRQAAAASLNAATDGAAVPLPACAQHAAGSYHSLFLTRGGHVLSCGYKSDGALGIPFAPTVPGEPHIASYFSPQLVEALADRRIIQVAAGAQHSAFVDEAGELFTCGRARYGKLGVAVLPAAPTTLWRGEMKALSLLPLRVSLHVRIKCVALGNDHTVAVAWAADGGGVFTFGRGGLGQLGLGDRKDHAVPAKMLTPGGDVDGTQHDAKPAPKPEAGNAASALITETLRTSRVLSRW